MLWIDQVIEGVSGPQLVNDSKTPSGQVHVGALRGPLIHDAAYRALLLGGTPARYTYGIDDYDPLDELPPVDAEQFRPSLGMPLCNVPAPPGTGAANLAEFYISPFLDVFDELGIRAEIYRTSEIYRRGGFDTAIDTILDAAGTVRRIDREVAGAKRDDDWYPFQVICESCGKIGTTRVFAWDGEKVSYRCEPRLVTWAAGCGHAGSVSPHGGSGKLSWKLEWTAKWATFGITIEGAGKDHNTRGGSREVAVRCLEEIFRLPPPLNIPYEFFLVGGAKMSSSRGVGVTARRMANLLPPELLRFLMVRTQARRPVDFTPNHEKTVRLYDDFDRLREQVSRPDADPEKVRLYEIAEVEPEPGYFVPPFDLLLSLVQMPHLDVAEKAAGLKGAPLTELDRRHLDSRVRAARYWLENFADPRDRMELQDALPDGAAELSVPQREFLHRLAAALEEISWEPAILQVAIFDAARATPISQPQAFSAIYRVLFDRQSGPRAGNLLSFLDRDFVLRRFREVARPAPAAFWEATALPAEELRDWVAGQAGGAAELSAVLLLAAAPEGPGSAADLEITVGLPDGKRHTRRTLLMVETAKPASGPGLEAERAAAAGEARRAVAALEAAAGRAIPLDTDTPLLAAAR